VTDTEKKPHDLGHYWLPLIGAIVFGLIGWIVFKIFHFHLNVINRAILSLILSLLAFLGSIIIGILIRKFKNISVLTDDEMYDYPTDEKYERDYSKIGNPIISIAVLEISFVFLGVLTTTDSNTRLLIHVNRSLLNYGFGCFYVSVILSVFSMLGKTRVSKAWHQMFENTLASAVILLMIGNAFLANFFLNVINKF